MTIQQFEQLILNELSTVITDIIQSKLTLDISAKSRAGAEISDYLEKKFVDKTQNHQYFTNSEFAPEGQTKNPWDARTFFNLNGFSEEIWIDFKALKITSANTNPDIGTPNKVINFINQGNFYIAFVYVYYQATNTGLEFVQHNDNYVKTYFLKDIHHTFRRNPKNQLQVNANEVPETRTREEFINILFDKLKESHERQIEISNRKLAELETIKKELLEQNRNSMERLLKNL